VKTIKLGKIAETFIMAGNSLIYMVENIGATNIYSMGWKKLI